MASLFTAGLKADSTSSTSCLLHELHIHVDVDIDVDTPIACIHTVI